MKKNLLQTTDPLGRTIFCTMERWKDHILIKRPWMDTQEYVDLTIKTLEEPNFGIYSNPIAQNRECFYRFAITRYKRYLKVIVAFNDKKIGEVITVHPSNSGKRGEILLWR